MLLLIAFTLGQSNRDVGEEIAVDASAICAVEIVITACLLTV